MHSTWTRQASKLMTVAKESLYAVRANRIPLVSLFMAKKVFESINTMAYMKKVSAAHHSTQTEQDAASPYLSNSGEIEAFLRETRHSILGHHSSTNTSLDTRRFGARDRMYCVEL